MAGTSEEYAFSAEGLWKKKQLAGKMQRMDLTCRQD